MKDKRTAEPLPYYRWYWRDWRASRAVSRLSWEARGLYRELLDECWAKGCLPDDLKELAEIARCPQTAMRKHWPALRVFFVQGEDGHWVNERLDAERTEADRQRVANARAGKRSGEVRRGESGHSDPSANGRSTVVQRSFQGRSTSSSSSSSKQSNSSSSAVANTALRPEGHAASARRADGSPTPVAGVLAGFDLVRAELGKGPARLES